MHNQGPETAWLNAASILWGAITLTALYLARPVLYGWLNDPTLRFALVSFILWLLSAVLQWRRLPSTWPLSKTTLVVLASVLLCLGIMGELQAFIYLAGGILISLPIYGSLFKVFCFIILSSLWMPALAWLLYPYLGNFLPWLTLFVAATLFIYSLSLTLLRYASKTSHTSI